MYTETVHDYYCVVQPSESSEVFDYSNAVLISTIGTVKNTVSYALA